MAQYIDKADVVAEIERRISVLKANESVISMLAGGMFVNEFKDLLSFLNTIEVKEVDLEKEIKEEYLKRRRYRGRDNMLVVLNQLQFEDLAKYFYELGIKAQKGE